MGSKVTWSLKDLPTKRLLQYNIFAQICHISTLAQYIEFVKKWAITSSCINLLWWPACKKNKQLKPNSSFYLLFSFFRGSNTLGELILWWLSSKSVGNKLLSDQNTTIGEMKHTCSIANQKCRVTIFLNIPSLRKKPQCYIWEFEVVPWLPMVTTAPAGLLSQ